MMYYTHALSVILAASRLIFRGEIVIYEFC